ncbi:hypothetical protein MY04_05755 (plasmid) [Flammeovirga sp. MY04]|uniref:OmpL47-type beta-barrel domain-containing protein n=1 Tax=Flammeovirga sp. MY04 TaxID=1191459 RepID=UPI0008060FBF|nr:hypothetical protein [Flammeovirga sp. MY04]ANQ52882.1 hypothetical protein MY04_05755 [Flammeovirga sp. MY04]
MLYKKYIFCWLLLLIYSIVYGQNYNDRPKGYFVDSLNNYYQQVDLPVYLYVGDKTGAIHQLVSTDQKNIIFLDGEGRHVLKHYDAIEKVEQKFILNSDGTAPKSRLKFTSPFRYYDINQKKLFFGVNSKALLLSKDNMSGVREQYVSVNGQPFTLCSDTLVFQKEMDYNIKYYAMDNVGNREEVSEDIFTIDHSAPNTLLVLKGNHIDNIISSETKIQLISKDTISGVKNIYYSIDNNSDYRSYNNGENIILKPFSDGYHTISFYAVDRVDNIERMHYQELFLDKSAPITASDIIGDRYVTKKGDVYFSGRTKMKLTAVDNKSGVKEVRYSINDQGDMIYNSPFYLPQIQGKHQIRFYSIDNLGNDNLFEDSVVNQYTHIVNEVYLDLTGPSIDFKINGPSFLKEDTVYISPKTELHFKAFDKESGLQKITYSIDSNLVETGYEKQISIKKEGYHKVTVYAYDQVNNKNTKVKYYAVDNKGPQVFLHPSVKSIYVDNDIDKYPYYMNMYLAATDDLTSVTSIRYSINNKSYQEYTGVIKGFKRNKKYVLNVEVEDMVGNIEHLSYSFRTLRRKDEKQGITQ